MADGERSVRLQISARSIVVAVALFGVTIAALAMVAASARVIGWILVAATVAGLLNPIVAALSGRMHRGLAVAAVMVATVAIAGYAGYRVVDDINDQLRELERALPRAAFEIERSERFGETATEARLAERVSDFVDELPERLRGGDVDDALRSAATRGVAFLATGVLTIFFIIHGRRLLDAAARQLSPARQVRVRRVASAAYERAWRYVAGSIGMAIAAGLVVYACARLLDLPGPAALALWMALVDLVPLVGVILGALPVVLLAGATSPWWETAVVALVLVAFQVFEALVLQRHVERRSVHLGPFITLAVAMVGLELYGIGGALVALVVTVLVATVADELVDASEGVDAAPVTSAG